MSSSPHCSLLGLPRELRDLIYTTLFRSLVFDANDPQPVGGDSGPDQRLAILCVSRQIYEEASPLVLPHVRICCRSAVDMVRQLKHLRVDYDMLRLSVPRQALEEEADAGPRDSVDPVPRGFHVGALLGLFPGLELDLLELTDGMHDGLGAFASYHAPDVISSLLRAAGGYREVRAAFRGLNCCFPGSFADHSQECFRADAPEVLDAWAGLIRARFRPPGWAVEMYFDDEAPADEGYWDRHREAGFTLLEGLEARDEAGRDQGAQGGDELQYWNFRACRGHGPCAVPEGDAEVLECVQAYPMSLDELREASMYLRVLVSEGDWARIERLQEESGMTADGPYDDDGLW
ncbi:hypothetical protein KVR01_013312 [Diaporthe batatas]|uniref:uncharacterized protein n=1 Tax=Diaporthe batatas TaxID=748121 RepID=UPI001D03E1CD|nr:uncharacterized protein KVR01_013312 [Diaporthe batatas]KAG8156899.1 hypothetical protein KVR01_013312 [Diaporthe batatas]